MKKGIGKKLDILAGILCLLVLLTAFLQFVAVRLPADNKLILAALEKIGLEDGTISFSAYQMFRGIYSTEFGWSLVGLPAGDMRALIALIVVPYALAVLVIVLECLRGRWRYIAAAILSLAAVCDMVYGMAVRLPVILGNYLNGLIDSRASRLLELAMGESYEEFLREHILRCLGPGFWAGIVLMAVIFVISVLSFALLGKKK